MSPALSFTNRPRDASQSVPTAPDELWRAIFRFATITAQSNPLYDVNFSPFRESWLDRYSSDDSLEVKKSIVLVCRHWRALGAEFLEILKCCPKVEILVQPTWVGGSEDNVTFWGDSSEVGLASALATLLTNVKRVDWCTIGNESFHDSHSRRLAGVLRAATNIRYLSLRYKVDPFPGPSSITLPSLTTLRVRGEIGIFGLNTPNLAHIIVNNISVASDYCVFSSTGSSLRVIQLEGYGNGYEFDVLRLAPSLRELCCSVRRETVVMLGCLHESIHTVRLYCVANPDAPAIAGFRKKSVVLYHKPSLPSLKRVVLHGDWSIFSKHPDFRLFRMRVLDRGCVLDYADGRSVE